MIVTFEGVTPVQENPLEGVFAPTSMCRISRVRLLLKRRGHVTLSSSFGGCLGPSFAPPPFIRTLQEAAAPWRKRVEAR